MVEKLLNEERAWDVDEDEECLLAERRSGKMTVVVLKKLGRGKNERKGLEN